MACLDDDNQGQPLEVIWELELGPEILDKEVWQSIGKRGFDPARHFAAYIHTLRWNCVTATDPRLFQAPFRAGIRIDAYQLEPLRKALLLPRVNLFIADDVGLGKTIEAGLIASELLLRRRVRELVVACPPSMLLQWKDELETRFGLTFEILDRGYIERVRQERGYGVNPWTTFPRFLVSHRLLVDETYAGPLRAWLENFRPGTLFIFDEAHHAAPASGARYAIDSRITRAIRDLAPRFEHRLFLSATPHNGHSNSFSALLEILDDQRFTRGVKVLKSNLAAVMVRRLKEDLRQLVGGFPERKPVQVDIKDLPPDAPELVLSRLLDTYRGVRQLRMVGLSKRKQAEGAILISGLQQRLLSSVEAFARTLKVHRNTMERLWASEPVEQPAVKVSHTPQGRLDLVSGVLDRDDDRSQMDEADRQALEDEAIAAATAATAGDRAQANIAQEKALLDEMAQIADVARGLPDARVRYLIDWIRLHMCPGACLPGQRSPKPGAAWTDLRLLIFTEYQDTERYLVNLLRMAVADSDLAEQRIEVFHGPTPPEKREAIKQAFNMAPNKHPVRILVATDAAREGLNLQAHCWNLFHFDVPWNPSRLEQRNGRIDRKLQPSDTVFCHYFVYTQRPEDRVLRALVRKTEIIRKELGSLADVLEDRLAKTLRGGIRHDESELLEREIEKAGLDAEKRETAKEELEATRARREDLQEEVDLLRGRINDAQKWIGLDPEHFRDALSCALELSGTKPLTPLPGGNGGLQRFGFPDLDTRQGGDPSWAGTLDTLRALPKDGIRNFKWRRESPIRPVIFQAPDGINDDVVQLHLSHRVVQRLLGRFMAQGFVHHDLSRACLAQSADAIPRVVLLGRISLYGKGAVRLHEEILTVTARWIEVDRRRSPLAPYGRDAEAKTVELLEQAFHPGEGGKVPEVVAQRLLAAIPRDVEDLLPHLEKRGQEARADAEARLAERGRRESEDIRKVLEDQRRRVQAEIGKPFAAQLLLEFDEVEKRQVELYRRYWDRWIEKVARDLQSEPARILNFYNVASFRIEPVGLAYLWPMTG
jgi:superfamily II DNA or RNA helicase